MLEFYKVSEDKSSDTYETLRTDDPDLMDWDYKKVVTKHRNHLKVLFQEQYTISKNEASEKLQEEGWTTERRRWAGPGKKVTDFFAPVKKS